MGPQSENDTGSSTPSSADVSSSPEAPETGGTSQGSTANRSSSEAEFVQDLPSQVVATRAAEDGQSVEILYVRRVLERAVVDEVFGMGLDGAGRPKPVNVSPLRLAGIRRF